MFIGIPFWTAYLVLLGFNMLLASSSGTCLANMSSQPSFKNPVFIRSDLADRIMSILCIRALIKSPKPGLVGGTEVVLVDIHNYLQLIVSYALALIAKNAWLEDICYLRLKNWQYFANWRTTFQLKFIGSMIRHRH